MLHYDDFIVENYLEEAMSQFDNFHRHYSNGTMHCKCHICGDSEKRENVARLNAQKYDNVWFVKCYNCGTSHNWFMYLREYHDSLYNLCMDELKFGRIRALQNARRGKKTPIEAPCIPEVEVLEEEEIVEIKGIIFPPNVHRLDTITNVDHPIIKYVESRKIPREKWNLLYFTSDFRSLVASVKEMGDGYTNHKEPRLVIPIFSGCGVIVGFQGRALLKQDEAIKYMTIKVSDEASKLYGTERVDPNKTVLVLEGPIDSLFLDNAIAMTGGSLSLDNMPYPDTRAFLLDIEPRHRDTHTRIESLIDSGERIVMFDKCPWKGKDINDILQNNDVSIEQLSRYIHNNIVSGAEAKLRFNNWSKTNKRMIEIERNEENINRKRNDIFKKIKEMGAK